MSSDETRVCSSVAGSKGTVYHLLVHECSRLAQVKHLEIYLTAAGAGT